MECQAHQTEIGKFLLKVKEKNGIKSDLAFARFLGVPHPTLYRIIHNAAIPNDETCIKIATVTKCDPVYVIALAHKSASRTPEVTKAWNQILKKLATVAIIFLLFVSAFQGVGKASTGLHKSDKTIHYRTFSVASDAGSCTFRLWSSFSLVRRGKMWNRKRGNEGSISEWITRRFR